MMPSNNKSLISVVIPTYNRADVIAETIQSVLAQTYKELEIIIIDDGSTDNTEEIIKTLKDQRIKYKKIFNNGRPAVPRNIGIKQANGEYIAFLDSDDLWRPEKLEKQLKIFEKYPELIIVSTAQENFPAGTKEKYLFNKRISFEMLLKKNIIANSSVLIKKEIFNKVGLLDEAQCLKAVEDYDLWLRVLRFQDNSAYLLKECLLLYRLHQANISKNVDIWSEKTPIEKLDIIFNKHKDYRNGYSMKILNKLIKRRELNKIKEQLYCGQIPMSDIFRNKEFRIIEKLFIVLARLYKILKKNG